MTTIGATIPTALDIRDRCQSEGNLLLVNPNNVEDHQATIVSLPPQHFEDYQDSKFFFCFVVVYLTQRLEFNLVCINFFP